MKYLQHYTEQATTALLKENGAFFAFSDAQFNEQKKEGVEYVNTFGGMVCPKENARAILDGLSAITAKGIAADIAENGKEAIIKRELSNHEAYYTGDTTSTVDALSGYGFTLEDIQNVYKTERLTANA